MEPREIRTVLQYPNKPLVLFLVDQANLTANERKVIDMREHGGYTIESAAEALDISPRAVSYIYHDGMEKLNTSFSSMPFLSSAILKQ